MKPVGRVMAVDPGDVRIGLAVSDPLGIIANPLQVLQHISRDENARRIANIAAEKEAVLIVVGQPLNSDGEVGPAAKKSTRLARAIQKFTDTDVLLWDESGTTKAAQRAYIEMNVPKKKRRGHLDHIAATIILQSYLDANASPTPTPMEEKPDGEDQIE
ncbi:MAG: Holliday junction resolvase RuvX [Anaerolineae bacterium]|jgi:putative Holliday junction resolvase|nr:Holliday junction resolvase RuvX [Anaerolineae bacterium]